jgi:hypothetical protein
LSQPTSFPMFADVTPGEWDRLASRRIFFGHHSVGGNILDGVAKLLQEHPGIRLRVMETADPSEMRTPGLYHARVGKNMQPGTKLAAWAEVAGAMGGEAVALLKYCYVDVERDTDTDRLFAEYRDGVARLRAARPGLRVVHVTLPLQTDWGAFWHYWRHFKGKYTTYRELNWVRHRFNERLRAEYAGREPIFDLARLESVGPAGESHAVRYRRTTVPVLARIWTDDGGHLSHAGRRHVGEAFLAALAKL